ncbi:MAG: phospholipase phosphocholine-specific [Sphaerisporangium sp.]|nr:phospholipase phosphocholine-specific [Sphaerisporangium sp.]
MSQPSGARTVAGDLTSAFDFTSSGPRPAPARPAGVPAFSGRWRPAPPADQSMPVQEEGTRPARPLPYQPNAWGRVAGGNLKLTLANTGSASVHMALYPYAGEFALPVHVDVHGSTTLDVPVQKGSYNLTLTGPNGFRREFAGALSGAASGVVVEPEIEARQRSLRLTVTNTGGVKADIRIAPLAYGDPGDERSFTLKPGRSKHVTWHCEDHEGWYDLRVTCEQDPSYGRRLMGHIENGRPSVTG